MEKIKNNIKENLAIYLLIIAVIVIFLIIRFIGSTNPSLEKELDTSLFKVVNTKEANRLFDDSEAKMLIIGSRECSATHAFVPVMQISLAKGRYNIYYLEILDEDKNSDSYKEFVSKLDVPYNGKVEGDKEVQVKDFMGATPMILIIKNKKVVYGSAGTVSEKELTGIANTYGVANEKS